MKVKVSRNTLYNWGVISNVLIGNLKVSFSPNFKEFSLDENLGASYITSGTLTTAEELVSVIGDTTFKELIYNLLNEDLFSYTIGYSEGIEDICDNFDKDNSPEGYEYWNEVEDKLYEEYGSGD